MDIVGRSCVQQGIFSTEEDSFKTRGPTDHLLNKGVSFFWANTASAKCRYSRFESYECNLCNLVGQKLSASCSLSTDVPQVKKFLN